MLANTDLGCYCATSSLGVTGDSTADTRRLTSVCDVAEGCSAPLVVEGCICTGEMSVYSLADSSLDLVDLSSLRDLVSAALVLLVPVSAPDNGVLSGWADRPCEG